MDSPDQRFLQPDNRNLNSELVSTPGSASNDHSMLLFIPAG
jgi:hypothetical protein